MGHKLDNVIALYVSGVRDGHLFAALDKYVADGFVQHSPGIGLGRPGFLRAYEPLLARHARRAVWPLRGFEDGRKVFLQSFQTFGYRDVERVVFDLFDTDDDDLLTAHWSVTVPLARSSVSGRSQLDGPALVADLRATEVNKRLVGTYLDEVLTAGDRERARSLLCADTFAQHNPLIADGIDGHDRFLTEMAVSYVQVEQLVGAGNFVAALSTAHIGGSEHRVFDLFRVEAGRIVEHWDATDLRVSSPRVPVAPRRVSARRRRVVRVGDFHR
jgi:predicted SnoaL-like aldol condensation-catalyzing enzyme